MVAAVAPEGPAARAGLTPGDVLVEANGRRLRNYLDWEAVKLDLHVGRRGRAQRPERRRHRAAPDRHRRPAHRHRREGHGAAGPAARQRDPGDPGRAGHPERPRRAHLQDLAAGEPGHRTAGGRRHRRRSTAAPVAHGRRRSSDLLERRAPARSSGSTSSATARSPSPTWSSDDRRPLALAARHPLRLARDADPLGRAAPHRPLAPALARAGRGGARARARHPRRGARRRCAPTSTTPTSTSAAEYERRFRHDVMAHVHAFGDQAPAARPFLHLGATSAFVTDNADLIVMREGLRLLLGRLDRGARRARGVRPAHARPCPAWPTPTSSRRSSPPSASARRSGCRTSRSTSRRSAHRLETLRFRGCKGTTGTQASFLELFDGDHDKVRELERRVAAKLGLPRAASPSPARPTRARPTAWCSTR